MISTNDYLSQLMEEIPQWLADYRPGDRVSFSDFMSGRVGYYPGSGLDGHLVKVGGMSHSVHCFLYVDYLETREHIVRELAVKGFRGYHSIGRIDFSEEDMYPHGHHQLDMDIDLSGRISSMIPGAKPYCFMEILERNADKNDSWGAERLAVTFLFADGIMTYYDLFSREYGKAPWILLLQDHGFGGNWDRFGHGGAMEKIALETDTLPQILLCADNTHPWCGYRLMNRDVEASIGGMYGNHRYICRKR